MTPDLDYEAIGSNVCKRCGMTTPEPHGNPQDCIDALRDVIADLEFAVDQSSGKPPAAAKAARRRDRTFRLCKNARLVILDGERLTLTEAGRRLGLTASALHFRIVNRAGAEYGEVDLRAIQADVKRVAPGAVQ